MSLQLDGASIPGAKLETLRLRPRSGQEKGARPKHSLLKALGGQGGFGASPEGER